MDTLVSIDRFIEGLRDVPEPAFTPERIHAFLKSCPIDPDSLDPYVHFSRVRYTRNLIYRDPLFEVIALCWAPGHASPIHDHADQYCWMAVPIGKLYVQNFKAIDGDPRRAPSCLATATSYWVDKDNPAVVTPEEPIHHVGNPKELNELCVSVHVYSKPILRCMAFDLEVNKSWEVPLGFYSVYGHVVPAAET